MARFFQDGAPSYGAMDATSSLQRLDTGATNRIQINHSHEDIEMTDDTIQLVLPRNQALDDRSHALVNIESGGSFNWTSNYSPSEIVSETNLDFDLKYETESTTSEQSNYSREPAFQADVTIDTLQLVIPRNRALEHEHQEWYDTDSTARVQINTSQRYTEETGDIQRCDTELKTVVQIASSINSHQNQAEVTDDKQLNDAQPGAKKELCMFCREALTVTRDGKLIPGRLNPGDHIATRGQTFCLGLFYDHHAIVTDVITDNDKADINVVDITIKLKLSDCKMTRGTGCCPYTCQSCCQYPIKEHKLFDKSWGLATGESENVKVQTTQPDGKKSSNMVLGNIKSKVLKCVGRTPAEGDDNIICEDENVTIQRTQPVEHMNRKSILNELKLMILKCVGKDPAGKDKNVKVQTIHRFEYKNRRNNLEETKSLALNCVGEDLQYCFLQRNCESLASECVNGPGDIKELQDEITSLQSRNCWWRVLHIVFFIIQSLFYFVNFSIYALFVAEDKTYDIFSHKIKKILKPLCYAPSNCLRGFDTRCDWYAVLIFVILLAIIFTIFLLKYYQPLFKKGLICKQCLIMARVDCFSRILTFVIIEGMSILLEKPLYAFVTKLPYKAVGWILIVIICGTGALFVYSVSSLVAWILGTCGMPTFSASYEFLRNFDFRGLIWSFLGFIGWVYEKRSRKTILWLWICQLLLAFIIIYTLILRY